MIHDPLINAPEIRQDCVSVVIRRRWVGGRGTAWNSSYSVTTGWTTRFVMLHRRGGYRKARCMCTGRFQSQPVAELCQSGQIEWLSTCGFTLGCGPVNRAEQERAAGEKRRKIWGSKLLSGEGDGGEKLFDSPSSSCFEP